MEPYITVSIRGDPHIGPNNLIPNEFTKTTDIFGNCLVEPRDTPPCMPRDDSTVQINSNIFLPTSYEKVKRGWFSTTKYFSTAIMFICNLNQEKSVIFFEFKHFKPLKNKNSTKFWTFVSHWDSFNDGKMSLPL
jgi:hypothetical protein